MKNKIYRNIILSVVWYGSETWSLTLREECKLTVTENKVLRIFVPTGDNKTQEWKTLLNEELSDLYSSPSIVRVIIEKNSTVGVVGSMGERRSAYRVVVGKNEGKRPLGIPTNKCEDNIKRYFQKVEFGDKDCIDLAKDMDRWRVLVNTLMSLGVLQNS
jgi:hypothetical protein